MTPLLGAARLRNAFTRTATVRVRTTIAATAIVGAALVLGGIGLVGLLRSSSTQSVESAALLRSADVVALVAAGDIPNPIPSQGEETGLAQVVDSGGKVLAASANIAGEPPIAEFRPPAGQTAARTVRGLPIGENEPFRVTATTVATAQGPMTVYVAAGLELVNETVKTVSTVLVGGVPLLMALVAAVTWSIVGRALRPVERIRAEVAEISAKQLSRRVPHPGTDDEVGRLAATMNTMLGRLERAADNQRRFVADASHELRSPLAALRVELEVGRQHQDPDDWRTMTSDALTEISRMEELVSDLLILARTDSTADRAHTKPVDLDEIVLDEAKRARARGQLQVSLPRFTPVRIAGDESQLRRAVRNLIENAERHAESQIDISVARHSATEVDVVVADDGPGVPEADRARIFERFTRLDDARSRDAGGTGLGLSIARDVAALHGGSLSLVDTSQGACFRLRLPVPA